jgi:hypothetical protein
VNKLGNIFINCTIGLMMILMFVIGAWLLRLVVIHTYNVFSLSHEMIQVDAHVIDFVIEKEGSSRKGIITHPWKISYNLEYYFNGIKINYSGRGNGRLFPYLGHSSHQDAEEFLSKRITNSLIVGHVHPGNPRELYVNKPQIGAAYFAVLFLSLATTLGSIYLFVRWLKAIAYVRWD